MTKWSTEQEAFWAGEFGDVYADRNTGQKWIASNTSLFAEVLSHTGAVASVLELGANIGLNLSALRALLPEADLSAVEINPKAAARLRAMERVEVSECSILEFEPSRAYDLVLVKGVLIHLDPDSLPRVYDLVHRASGRYVCLAEYYSPSPVALSYRGHENRLFKRDFAGELLDRHPDLRLVSYGFRYRRDPKFPQDDINWFLLEKELGRSS
jgi:pseudaminic acid biosynthesis-associated methylase